MDARINCWTLANLKKYKDQNFLAIAFKLWLLWLALLMKEFYIYNFRVQFLLEDGLNHQSECGIQTGVHPFRVKVVWTAQWQCISVVMSFLQYVNAWLWILSWGTVLCIACSRREIHLTLLQSIIWLKISPFLWKENINLWFI